jgi:predicted MFS family arabinose efflux permease|tara:strand:- start:178 stop:1350 length:1173 start_codon:yes stop_codon:yes gene_type:complete
MTRFEKIILSITGGSHLSVHALMLALPSLLPVIRNEFDVGLDTLGFVVTVSAFMFGLGAIPAGWAEKRLGGRQLLLIYQVGSSISALLVALSGSFQVMVIGLGLMGFFCSIYHPAGLTLISHRVKSLTRGMAIHGIFGSTGSAIGPLLATTLAALISWRSAYAFLGIFNGLLAIGTFITIPYRKRSNIPEKEFANHEVKTNKPALILYFLTNAFMGMAYYGFTTFMPIHFAENTNSILPSLTANMKAGIFPTMVFIAGIGGQLVGARIGERFHKPTALMFIIMANIPFLLLMGYTSDLLLIISGIMLGVAYFSNQPIGNTLIARFTHSQNRGLGYGISFFLSFGIGSFAAGFSGVIAENMGVAAVFPAMGILLLPSVIFAFFMRRAAGSS